jgi:putative transposase
MAIDLGINNLMICYISTGKTYIISGRQLLSINRYFDKEISHYQSIAYAQQSKAGVKHNSTKRIQKLYQKRSRQVEHLLHAATKNVIDIAISEHVSAIVIGDLSHIRDNKDMGHVNNQKFHKWPFKKVFDLISYKAQDNGIAIEPPQDESYTSQCSPYAKEVSEASAQKSNRKYRGLYVVDSKVYNADCVGAYNILKKYLCRIGKANPAVVALDTPEMYRWNRYRFIGNPKLANSLAM